MRVNKFPALLIIRGASADLSIVMIFNIFFLLVGYSGCYTAFICKFENPEIYCRRGQLCENVVH